MNSNYRYQLVRYRGRGTRYTCPQCGRKYTFTRYIDTENNIIYIIYIYYYYIISDNAGKCNRLDKCGYHYTPRQYFTDNPHKSDNALVVDGSLRPCGYHYTPKQYYIDNPWKSDIGSLNGDNAWSKSQTHREIDLLTLTKPICALPEWVVEGD